ncbi:hypothetical protein HO133_008296 [Letharia lupina]|uniref:Acyltransferase 3 domain-containing protein n=1 Tax=Letharia lupina TaxID=560253 RepID=A0A8H6CNX7_9LECA|nr:uncharacterized protein HO133_008296 [Letharia lupina]KAF6226855.1 hypothetical protein HO133_008296 [Letharia lupina]
MDFFKRTLTSSLHPSATDEDLETLLKAEDGGTSFSTKYGLPTTASRFIKKIVLAILPNPIQRRLAPHFYKPSRIHSTSYLDGLRGIASFIVFVHHFTNWVNPYLAYYGVDNEKRPSSLVQLPFVRVIYSGRPMVHVFFVISGFVLSRKPLRLARAHKFDELHKTLSSSVFRRSIRLYLPAAFSTFFVLLLIRAGWARQPVDGGFLAQVGDWTSAMFDMTKPWQWDVIQNLRYDMHTWTLPVEMSMSMLLFVTITGLSRCKVPIRLGMMIMIMLYCFQSGRWAAVEFLGGAWIAEVDLIQEERATNAGNLQSTAPVEHLDGDQLNPTELPKAATWSGLCWTLLWWLQLAIALWICGWPNHDVEKAPGLAWLVKHAPEPYFSLGEEHYTDWRATPWYILASLQIVFACQQLPPLQRFLTTGPIQYLASISFALYLMHGPLFDSIGGKIMTPILHSVTSMDEAGVWELFFVWIAGLFALGIPCLWAADLFWRFIDRPCVDFARWVESKCTD